MTIILVFKRRCKSINRKLFFIQIKNYAPLKNQLSVKFKGRKVNKELFRKKPFFKIFNVKIQTVNGIPFKGRIIKNS